MTVYIVQVLLILLLGLLLQPGKSKKRKRCYLLFVFLMLAAVSGFRALSVGADTGAYTEIFLHIQERRILGSGFEPGFLLYLKLLRLISDRPGLMLMASSVICVGSAVLFTGSFSRDAVLSMALYVLLGAYFSQMNTMRQELAASISLAAFGLLITGQRSIRKTVSAGLLIGLAALFHTSALVEFVPFVLFLFLCREKQQKTRWRAWEILIVSFSASAIGFVFYPAIMTLVERLAPKYVHHFFDIWSDANYNAALFKTMIAAVFMAVGAIAFHNRRLNRRQSVAGFLLGFSVVFTALSMRMEIWDRLAGLFGIYTSLLWGPELVSAIRSPRNRAVMKGCILLFSAAYMVIVLIFRPEWTRVVPYLFRN